MVYIILNSFIVSDATHVHACIQHYMWKSRGCVYIILFLVRCYVVAKVYKVLYM